MSARARPGSRLSARLRPERSEECGVPCSATSNDGLEWVPDRASTCVRASAHPAIREHARARALKRLRDIFSVFPTRIFNLNYNRSIEKCVSFLILSRRCRARAAHQFDGSSGARARIHALTSVERSGSGARARRDTFAPKHRNAEHQTSGERLIYKRSCALSSPKYHQPPKHVTRRSDIGSNAFIHGA